MTSRTNYYKSVSQVYKFNRDEHLKTLPSAPIISTENEEISL